MAGHTTLRAVAVFCVPAPVGLGVEKGATSDSIVVEPEHEQPTAYQLRYECLTTIMISADRGYNQITVLKQYCTINTYGGLSHPGRLTHISPHRVSPESRIYSSPVFSPAPRGAQGRLSLLWARVPEIPAKLYRLWTLWTVRGALGADLAQGHRPLASRGGRQSKDVRNARGGGLTPLAKSSPL